MARQPKIIVTRKLPDAVEARMAALFDVDLNPDDHPFSAEELRTAVGQAEALVPTVGDQIDRDVLDAAGPQFRLLANFGVGVNHIALQQASSKNIIVTNTPDVLTEDTADLALALILMASRGLGGGERVLRAGKWSGWSPTSMMANRVHGKRLGIIGMGRIGTAVARRARGFSLSIHYHNRQPVDYELQEELGATYWESLDDMLAAVDIVSINCPQTEATHHLLDADRLRRLQPHAYLINTARGGIVDETALVEALQAGRLAGAGLDVFEEEPKVHPKLLEMENVVLLPHLGSAALEGRIAMGEKVIDNLVAVFDGKEPPDRVTP